MRVFRNELYLLLRKKGLIGLIIFLFFANAFLFLINEPSPLVKAQDYRNLYISLAGLNEPAADYLQEQLDTLDQGDRKMTPISRQEDAMEVLKKQMLYSDILSKTIRQDDFDQMLNLKLENLKDKGISIFQNTDLFEKRNKEKSYQDLQKLKSVEITFTNQHSFAAATEFQITDFVVFILLFAIVYLLFFQEKSLGLNPLLLSYKKGRTSLVIHKLSVLIVLLFVLNLIFHGSNILVASLKYGAINLNCDLQSIFSFRNSALTLTVGQYLILFLLSKFISYLSLAFLFCLLSVLMRQLLFIQLSAVGLLALPSVAIKILGPSKGMTEWLSYLKPLSTLKSNSIFQNYYNLNCFNRPLALAKAFFLSYLTFSFLAFSLTVLLYNRQPAIEELRKKQNNGANPAPKPYKTSLLRHETYKLLFRQRALHMMMLCLVCTVYFMHTYEPYFSPTEYYYRDYIDRLEGGLNREKITFVEGEKQRIQAVQDELKSLGEAGPAKGAAVDERVQELNYALSKGMAIDAVSNRLDYLKHKLLEIKNSTLPQVEKQEVQLATGQIFYERGYLEIFGRSYMPYRQDFLTALVLILMAIWLVLPFVCQEWESGMFQLIKGSSGLGKLISLKINLLIGYFSLAFFFLNLSLVYLMNKHYSLHLLNKKIVIGSIPDFSNFKFSIYLGQYLSLLLILRYLAFLVTLMFLVFLALKFKSQVKASIIAFIFLLLPLILYHLGIRSSEYLLLNPFLSGNVLLNLWQGRGIYLYFLLGPMIIFLWTRIKVECRK